MSYHPHNINTLPSPVSMHTLLASTDDSVVTLHDAVARATVRASPFLVHTLLGLPLTLDARHPALIHARNATTSSHQHHFEDQGYLGRSALNFLDSNVWFPRLLPPYAPSRSLAHYSWSPERDVCIVLCSGEHCNVTSAGHSCPASDNEDFLGTASRLSTPCRAARVVWMSRRVKLMLIAHLLFDPTVNECITSLTARTARSRINHTGLDLHHPRLHSFGGVQEANS